MAQVVRIHGDVAVYPAGACVSCLRPATQEIELTKVKGYAVRKVRVPFCDSCAALRRRKTARQALFERVATVSSLLLAAAVGLYIYVRLSSLAASATEARADPGLAAPGSENAWILLLAASSALVVFGTLYLLVRPWSRTFQSPATVDALRAVRIVDFDWETTTLAFRDDEYAEQFARANTVHGPNANAD
jgi:hypothetical protein